MSRGVGLALAAALMAALLVIAFLLGRDSRGVPVVPATPSPAVDSAAPSAVPTRAPEAAVERLADTPPAAVETAAPTTSPIASTRATLAPPALANAPPLAR